MAKSLCGATRAGVRRAPIHRRALALTTCLVASLGCVCSLSATAAAAAPSAGQLAFVAGNANGTTGAPTPGPAIDSALNQPQGVAVDGKGNLYIADSSNYEVEKVTPSGVLSVIAGTGSFGPPTVGPATSSLLSTVAGVAVDGQGNVYIADDDNSVIEKVTPEGHLSIFAGTVGPGGSPTPGPATQSALAGPTGVAVDSVGNVYIVDTQNRVVEKVTPSGVLSIFAGQVGVYGAPTAGRATASTFEFPNGVAVDGADNVYVSDNNANVVVKITPGGTLSIVAGNGQDNLPTPGPALDSPVAAPLGVAVDGRGDLYIAAADASLIEAVSPSGILSVVAGNGNSGTATAGPALSSSLDGATGVAVDTSDNVFIADTYNSDIEEVGAVFAPLPPVPPVSPAPPATLQVSTGGRTAATPTGGGYWSLTPTGWLSAHGGAADLGSENGAHLNQPIVAVTSTSTGHGYWLAGADGGVFAFGNARFYGSTGGLRLNQPVVGMARTPDDRGYWLVGADGGVFAFGDARFDGSLGTVHLNQPVVGMASTPDGQGYWLAAADGGVFSFGDAGFHASMGSTDLNKQVVGIASSLTGHGYWLVAADGGVFTFGDATFRGSLGATGSVPVGGMVAVGTGYRLISTGGTAYGFGSNPALG